VQHVHRYAGFLQTIEYGHMMCCEYLVRFHTYPEGGKIDAGFSASMMDIFVEFFPEHVADGDDAGIPSFRITDEVVVRAIDLVSGQLQQMKLLMDDRNAPLWGSNQTRPIVVFPMNEAERSPQMVSLNKKRKNNAGRLGVLIASVHVGLVQSFMHPVRGYIASLWRSYCSRRFVSP
jgi:hypothetical protein